MGRVRCAGAPRRGQILDLRQRAGGINFASRPFWTGMVGGMADIVLINPRFEVSYWGLEHALPSPASGPTCRSPACRCSRP